MMDMLRLSVWQINYVMLELFSDEILSIFLLQRNVLAAFSVILVNLFECSTAHSLGMACGIASSQAKGTKSISLHTHAYGTKWVSTLGSQVWLQKSIIRRLS